MTAAITVSAVNGIAPSPLDHLDEVAEYEKILKLRDEIFAGTHPRLTVPAHAIRKVPPLPSTQISSTAHVNVPPPIPVLPQQLQLPGLSLNDDVTRLGPPPHQPTEPVSIIQLKPTVSGIDPVLLTKSDDLVRAETHLQRQRLEKALRDQFEQRRLDARKRPAPAEAKPDFDVAAVLAKVLLVAKPELDDKVTSPKDDGSISESYDENSLYSSRAPDSTPEAGELEEANALANQISLTDNANANGVAEVRGTSSVNVPPLAMLQPTMNRHEAAYPVYPASAGRPGQSNINSVDLTGDGDDDDDEEEEEGEYSPPEAMEQFATPQDPNSVLVDPRSRPLRRYSELDDSSRRPGSPNGGNARMNYRGHNGRTQRGRDTSPDASSQNMPPRKKRRLDKKRRSGRGSPGVKDEPVSPPPFHEVPSLGSGKLRPAMEERPIVIDDTPTRHARYVPAPERYGDTPSQPSPRAPEPTMFLSDPRHASRAPARFPEQDLRRVASMHSLRDAPPPREHVSQVYDSPSRPRATPLARVDSPLVVDTRTDSRYALEAPASFDRALPPSVRASRTPAPVYREVYQDPEPQYRYVHEPMPPPVVERIVIDADGRRYREIIEPPRASIAPRPISHYVEREPNYQAVYDPPRAGSVMVEARPDARFLQDMPPPRIIRPAAEAGFARLEPYDPRTANRSVSVAPVDHTPRPPVYVDGRTESREPIRMSSVRPPAPLYDPRDPRAMESRPASVRPSVREGSVFVDDRSQVRREYASLETPQYRIVDEPQPRYVDAQGREVYLDGLGGATPRQVARY